MVKFSATGQYYNPMINFAACESVSNGICSNPRALYALIRPCVLLVCTADAIEHCVAFTYEIIRQINDIQFTLPNTHYENDVSPNNPQYYKTFVHRMCTKVFTKSMMFNDTTQTRNTKTSVDVSPN